MGERSDTVERWVRGRIQSEGGEVSDTPGRWGGVGNSWKGEERTEVFRGSL